MQSDFVSLMDEEDEENVGYGGNRKDWENRRDQGGRGDDFDDGYDNDTVFQALFDVN